LILTASNLKSKGQEESLTRIKDGILQRRRKGECPQAKVGGQGKEGISLHSLLLYEGGKKGTKRVEKSQKQDWNRGEGYSLKSTKGEYPALVLLSGRGRINNFEKKGKALARGHPALGGGTSGGQRGKKVKRRRYISPRLIFTKISVK